MNQPGPIRMSAAVATLTAVDAIATIIADAEAAVRHGVAHLRGKIEHVFALTHGQIEVLHDVARGSSGAVLQLEQRDGWVHVRLVWPGDQIADLALTAHNVLRLVEHGQPGRRVDARALLGLRRPA